MKIILLLALIFGLLTWAPWLDNARLYDEVLNSSRPQKDGTIDSSGNLVCNYKLQIFPLGRLVTSCEGSYYVTFWGLIL